MTCKMPSSQRKVTINGCFTNIHSNLMSSMITHNHFTSVNRLDSWVHLFLQYSFWLPSIKLAVYIKWEKSIWKVICSRAESKAISDNHILTSPNLQYQVCSLVSKSSFVIYLFLSKADEKGSN